MAKVRIVAEAEIGDLKTFWPDEPQGVTQKNLATHLQGVLVSDVMLKRFHIIGDSALTQAIRDGIEDNLKLGQRLIQSLDIEIYEP